MWRSKLFHFSLFPLEIGEMYLEFLFSNVENILPDFSSRNWGKGIQLSLSPLEMREIVFKFPFLFSKLGKGSSNFLSPLEKEEIVFKFLFSDFFASCQRLAFKPDHGRPIAEPASQVHPSMLFL